MSRRRYPPDGLNWNDASNRMLLNKRKMKIKKSSMCISRWALGVLVVMTFARGAFAQTPAERKAFIAESNQKWDRKWEEQQTHGFTVGTIDEFIGDHKFHGFTILARTPRSLVIASQNRPGERYSLYQTHSVQGNSLLLGPVRMPKMNMTHEQYLKFWKVEEPSAEFDEDKNYSGLYVDHLNFAAMFVIFEKRQSGAVPIQALYSPRDVTKPNFVDQKTNDNWLNRIRGYVTVLIPLYIKYRLGLDKSLSYDGK